VHSKFGLVLSLSLPLCYFGGFGSEEGYLRCAKNGECESGSLFLSPPSEDKLVPEKTPLVNVRRIPAVRTQKGPLVTTTF
jgi:hypothetical protein